MKLKAVTITGADDKTDIKEMLAVSAEFPFVEWGILVSKIRGGGPRFPSREWNRRFAANAAGLAVSTHVCGAWVRQLLRGTLKWGDLPDCHRVSQRVQINTHAERYVSTLGMMKTLGEEDNEYIFQWDGVNSHLTYAAHAYGARVAALFDKSGGAGKLPREWPYPTKEFWCGYAGGLGPENVVAQVRLIERVCDRPYWIDMEQRVRTDDDVLDMAKVRSVLSQLAPLIGG